MVNGLEYLSVQNTLCNIFIVNCQCFQLILVFNSWPNWLNKPAERDSNFAQFDYILKTVIFRKSSTSFKTFAILETQMDMSWQHWFTDKKKQRLVEYAK